MKALTVRQPWATFLALGVKQIETRSWATKHRGPIAIHAGSSMAGFGRCGTVTQIGGFTVERDRSGLLLRGPGLAWPYRLPLGEVIAIGNLTDVWPTGSGQYALSDLERSLGDHSPGRYAWALTEVARLRGVPATGSLGLWEWAGESLDEYPGAGNGVAS